MKKYIVIATVCILVFVLVLMQFNKVEEPLGERTNVALSIPYPHITLLEKESNKAFYDYVFEAYLNQEGQSAYLEGMSDFSYGNNIVSYDADLNAYIVPGTWSCIFYVVEKDDYKKINICDIEDQTELGAGFNDDLEVNEDYILGILNEGASEDGYASTIRILNKKFEYVADLTSEQMIIDAALVGDDVYYLLANHDEDMGKNTSIEKYNIKTKEQQTIIEIGNDIIDFELYDNNLELYASYHEKENGEYYQKFGKITPSGDIIEISYLEGGIDGYHIYNDELILTIGANAAYELVRVTDRFEPIKKVAAGFQNHYYGEYFYYVLKTMKDEEYVIVYNLETGVEEKYEIEIPKEENVYYRYLIFPGE